MTDKQIIINDQKNTIHRLQQECTEKTDTIIALGERLKAKEQECEQLKTWFVDEQIDNDKLQQLYQDEHCDNLKLKQTFTEIKDIAEVEIECKTYEIENDCFNKTRCKALNEHIDFIKQILQKISEVENE